MKMTKEEALKKIEELKKYIKDEEKKETSSKLKIINTSGDVLWESDKHTLKEAVEEAVNEEADLMEADLRGANLWGANLWGANRIYS